jgi:hypothetical protein
MSPTLIALLIGGILGLIFGFFVARKSAGEKPIKGGTLASAFHYLGASASSATLPTILIGTFIYRLGLGRNVLLAVGLLAVSAVCLLLYAAFEAQASQLKSPQQPAANK